MSSSILGRATRRRSLVVASALVLALGCFWLAKEVTIVRLAHAQVRTNPFVVTMHVYNYERNPQGELSHVRTVARRSDGTTARIGSVGPVDWGFTLKKITFMDDRSVTVSDLLMARTTLPRMQLETATPKRMLTTPPPDCRTSRAQVMLGNALILNYRVAIVQLDVGRRRLVSWNALDLGCEPLKYRATSAPRFGSGWRPSPISPRSRSSSTSPCAPIRAA